MNDKLGERHTLQDRVYQELSLDIAQGILLPGERLRVAHLAKRFGTSQAPVREALRRLTEEGLAVTVPYSGSMVKMPSWSEIQEIYALRAELEAYAIRRAMAHPNLNLASVRRAIRDLERAVRSGDELHVLDADLALHREVVSLAGGDLVLEMWETLVQRFRGARLSLMRSHPDDFRTVVPSHTELIDAIAGGDAEHAQQAFRSHLASAVGVYATRTGQTLATPPFSAGGNSLSLICDQCRS